MSVRTQKFAAFLFRNALYGIVPCTWFAYIAQFPLWWGLTAGFTLVTASAIAKID